MREQSKKSKRKLVIVISAVFAVLVLGVVGVIFFKAPITDLFKPKATPATVSEKEVARLKAKTPALFSGKYATVSADALRTKILNDKMDRALLTSEATRRGITDVNTQLNTSFNAIKTSYGSKQDFQSYLSDQGVTEAELKEELKENIIINELAKDLVSEKDISEAEAQSYFEANKSRYPDDFSAAKAQVTADLLGAKRLVAIDELLTQLKSAH